LPTATSTTVRPIESNREVDAPGRYTDGSAARNAIARLDRKREGPHSVRRPDIVKRTGFRLSPYEVAINSNAERTERNG
jgi:hypothetical protein